MEQNLSEENVKEVKKSKDIKKLLIELAVIVVIAIVVAVFMVNKKSNVNTNTSSIEEIKEKLKIDIAKPEAAESVAYDIENNSIAKVTYAKKLPSGEEMHFVLRSSYAKEEDLENFGYNVNFETSPIFMTSVCNDGTEVTVEAYVALDEDGNMKYMKALWIDNDKYYSMITDDLITREDFLQEVNRVIIDNHIDFADGEVVDETEEIEETEETEETTE